MSRRAAVVSIAVDTGGTFTDVVGVWAGRIHVVKVPSTPADPSRAVLAGVRALLARLVAAEPPAAESPAAPSPAGGTPAVGHPDDGPGRPPFTLIHGSTVGTNALLERRGARVGLVTNAGFEDVLLIGRQNRPQLYALVGHRPPPLVTDADRIGVAGRIGAAGEELAPLDEAELAALPGRLAGIESIAICLLHSYARPDHERRIATALAPLGVPLSVSSQLLPEHREYERTATTVVNASIAPVMDRYLGRLEADAGAERIRIMGSAGGVIPLARARVEAVHTVLSGPAGGVIGALDCAARHDIGHIITFDMGGTSTDVSLAPGRPLHTREFTIAGLPVAIPVLDIHTVGAGGGSLARIDEGGALRVGPESAGAEPGPICYGRGGTRVTVTDANVWLGRLPTAGWAHATGDAPGLAADAIRAPLEVLAAPLGGDPDHAAAGIIDVVDTAMEGALRVISVERGYDPVDFTLVPFGGAAGLHAVELARRLGIPRLLVPAAPGVLSAWGMLVAPVRRDATRTVLRAAVASDEIDVAELAAPLVRELTAAMAEDEIGADRLAITTRVDARYRGQSFELNVAAEDWATAFHAAHQARYGYARPGEAVELVTVRVEAVAPVRLDARAPEATATAGATPAAYAPERAGAAAGAPDRDVPDADPHAHGAPPSAAAAGARVWHDGGWIDGVRRDRASLGAGDRLAGPALITEYSATFWLPPEWHAAVLGDGALLVTHAAASGADT
jgi:N-methylhydantoinase A